MSFYLNEYFLSLLKGVLYWGEYHISENRPINGHKFFKKAADIANKLDNSVHPEILDVRARAYLKYANSCINLNILHEAKIYMERAMESLSASLSIRTNKTVCYRVAPLKSEKRFSHNVRMICICFINYHKYYQAKKMLPKAYECLKLAHSISWQYFGEKSSFTRTCWNIFDMLNYSYGPRMRELIEFERVLVHFKQFHIDPDVKFYTEYTPEQEMVNDMINHLYRATNMEKVKEKNEIFADASVGNLRPRNKYFEEINRM